jgi:hypothetical protein
MLRCSYLGIALGAAIIARWSILSIRLKTILSAAQVHGAAKEMGSIMSLFRWVLRVGTGSARPTLALLTLGLGVLQVGSSQAADVDYAAAAAASCADTLGYVACANLGKRVGPPGPPVFTGTWFAAIAKSSTSREWGASWREQSEAAANRDALLICARSGRKDCKVVLSGANNCLSLAESPDGAWAAADSVLDRTDAISKATNSCRKYGGRSCAVVVTPCGRQDKAAQPCVKEYSNDISRGAAWANMTPEQRALWNKRANGACK